MDTNKLETESKSPEDTRRDFIKRYGKYAAAAPVVTLMAVGEKAAACSNPNNAGNCPPGQNK